MEIKHFVLGLQYFCGYSMPKYREAPKSEMDSQRELLDQLMGINRNQDREEDEVRDFRDDRVCKDYLCGLCVHGLHILLLYSFHDAVRFI